MPGYFIPLYCCIGSSFLLRSLPPSVYQTSIHPTKPIVRVPRSKAFLNAHRVPITQSFTYASIIECNILHWSCLLTSLSLPPECKLLDCRDHVWLAHRRGSANICWIQWNIKLYSLEDNFYRAKIFLRGHVSFFCSVFLNLNVNLQLFLVFLCNRV